MQFIDLSTQRARIAQRLDSAVLKVLAEGRYILGPEVDELEKKLGEYLGVKHAIACANGTDALLMPLMARGIGVGDAVFCPSFTFAATAEVVALAGAEPVFVDILPDSYTIDPASLKQAIIDIKNEGRLVPKAIIPVDLFGLAADYGSLGMIAEEHDLFVIEDAAQSIGGKRDNTMCGSFGHVAATSFYPAKPLGCYGDGGAMFTHDDELAAQLRSILFHGKGESQYDTVRIGLNSRLDTIQAAILLEKLPLLEEEIALRNLIANRYREGLEDVVKVPAFEQNERCAFAQYTIEAKQRDALKAYLHQAGIPSMIYYIKPLHKQAAYQHFPRVSQGLRVTESLCDHVLSLPMHPYLDIQDQAKIIATIREFYQK